MRSNLKSNLQIYKSNSIKIYKICDALRQQSYVATLNFSFTALATVALLETASLVTRWQQVAPTKKSVVGGGGLKGVGKLFCFGFASPCACTLFESCRAERHSSPHPLYNKVKNNLKWLFFTQESQTRNPKFNQTKFSTLEIQVAASKFKICSKICLKRRFFVAAIVVDML